MSSAGPSVERLVAHLGLEPHPEGGWYRRTWTAPVPVPAVAPDTGTDAAPGVDHESSRRVDPDRPVGRACGSSILFLLPADLESRWHRIDASELWHHSAGAPIRLSTWSGGHVPVQHCTLGSDLLDGEVAQHVVDPDHWQSARSSGAWSLAVCVVVPEFRFEAFEMAEAGWTPPA